MANEVFLSTKSYRYHLKEQKEKQSERADPTRLTNPDPDSREIPLDLVPVGLVQTDSVGTSYGLTKTLREELLREARRLGVTHIFDVRYSPLNPTNPVTLLTGNAYKPREHR